MKPFVWAGHACALYIENLYGKSPGLLVMRGDSCPKGREFKSRHSILDGHFSHLFLVKIVMCV